MLKEIREIRGYRPKDVRFSRTDRRAPRLRRTFQLYSTQQDYEGALPISHLALRAVEEDTKHWLINLGIDPKTAENKFQTTIEGYFFPARGGYKLIKRYIPLENGGVDAILSEEIYTKIEANNLSKTFTGTPTARERIVDFKPNEPRFKPYAYDYYRYRELRDALQHSITVAKTGSMPPSDLR